MTMDPIGEGMVVRLRYTMKAIDGRILDRSDDDGETYLHGAGAIVAGLERALAGTRAGDEVSVLVRPEEGYGVRQPSPGPQPVPRATFPEGASLKPGVSFEAETPDGKPVTLYITRVETQAVYVDINHPFAGMSLLYDVEILAVRAATAAEMKNQAPKD